MTENRLSESEKAPQAIINGASVPAADQQRRLRQIKNERGSSTLPRVDAAHVFLNSEDSIPVDRSDLSALPD
jgi:hypothetical protein